MATGMRNLLRFNAILSNNSHLRYHGINLTSGVVNGINAANGRRFLFSRASLGLPGYEKSRQMYLNQFVNVEDTFRSRMQQVCKDDESMVFTEDLKSMLHLINKNPEDLELIMNMMYKFNEQSNQLRFGMYIFGPVVMRALYHLDEPDLAFSAFSDPRLLGFFDQLRSYQILLCLLYKHEKYSQMRDVYNMIKDKNIEGNIIPRNALIMVMAGCYKENTPESLQYALDVWKDIIMKDPFPIRRVLVFVSALAIKQNSPHIALEILSITRSPRYVSTRCLKVWAYLELNKLLEIIPIFKLSLESSRTNNFKEDYFIDIIEMIEKRVENSEEKIEMELQRLISQLRTQEHVVNTTMDEYICKEIEMRRKTNETLQNIRNFERGPRDLFYSRPGLRDLI